MIPPDVASSLRQILPDQQAATNAQTMPVAAAQKIADVLSNLVPGQRVLAEIQALLPNGNYRAIVAQREITLALPFSAKAGDTLELEVAESDGKVTLAFVANRSSGEQASKLSDSASTTLSQAGKLIGDLLNGISDQGKRAAPAPLNGNLPLVDDFPDQAANLAPILKDALTKSGVFYESHQARWVAGELPTAALKLEPQGKLSITLATTTGDKALDVKATNFGRGTTAAANIPATGFNHEVEGTPSSTPSPAAVDATFDIKNTDLAKGTTVIANMSVAEIKPEAEGKPSTTPGTTVVDGNLTAKTTDAGKAVNIATNTQAATQSSQPGTLANAMPRDLVPIVQQQLDALSTQNYAWQGQIWPGQQMQWEIGENPDGARSTENDAIARWQTRLKLALPMLGGIDAILRLNPAGEVSITVTAESASSEARLRESAAVLGHQMESAGLTLTQLLVEHGETKE